MREPRQDPGYREAPKTSLLTPIARQAAPNGGEGRPRGFPRKKPRKFFFGVR